MKTCKCIHSVSLVIFNVEPEESFFQRIYIYCDIAEMSVLNMTAVLVPF